MYSADVKFFASSFSVPAKIADEMLKLCSGEQLKVILCILRNPEIEAEEIARITGLSLSEVEECAEYWADSGIIISETVEPNVVVSATCLTRLSKFSVKPTATQCKVCFII